MNLAPSLGEWRSIWRYRSGGGTTVVGGLNSGGTSFECYRLKHERQRRLPAAPQGDGVLSSAACGLSSAANGLTSAAGGISDAIRSVLTGDMPVPWGKMTTGSKPTQNAISLAIPGFGGVGEACTRWQIRSRPCSEIVGRTTRQGSIQPKWPKLRTGASSRATRPQSRFEARP